MATAISIYTCFIFPVQKVSAKVQLFFDIVAWFDAKLLLEALGEVGGI
jgi:hypothetical protein